MRELLVKGGRCKMWLLPLNKALDIVRYYPDEDIMLGLYAYAADHKDADIARLTRAAQKRANQGLFLGPVASPGNLSCRRMETELEEEQIVDDILDADVSMICNWLIFSTSSPYIAPIIAPI